MCSIRIVRAVVMTLALMSVAELAHAVDLYLDLGATGSPVGGSYENFYEGEPNDGGGTGAPDCLRVVASGPWRDLGCDSTLIAVCESGG